MNILMVITAHDKLGDTGKKTGFWLEEFAAPYYVFKDAGANKTGQAAFESSTLAAKPAPNRTKTEQAVAHS